MIVITEKPRSLFSGIQVDETFLPPTKPTVSFESIPVGETFTVSRNYCVFIKIANNELRPVANNPFANQSDNINAFNLTHNRLASFTTAQMVSPVTIKAQL